MIHNRSETRANPKQVCFRYLTVRKNLHGVKEAKRKLQKLLLPFQLVAPVFKTEAKQTCKLTKQGSIA